MKGYILRRLLSLIPVLFVVAVVVFLLMHITPGDPAAVILGPEASPNEIAELREDLGLNRPVTEQFVSWFGGVLQGDLGNSIFMKQPVLQAFFEHLGPTLSLAIMAQILAIVVAIPLGILAAKFRGSILGSNLHGHLIVRYFRSKLFVRVIFNPFGWC